MNSVKLLIDGKFVESRTTEWRNVVNPATQAVLARVPMATKEHSHGTSSALERSAFNVCGTVGSGETLRR